MKPSALLLLTALVLVSSPAVADDEYVTFAKSLPARDFDANLPAQPVEQWLANALPGTTLLWEEYVTDCGEQTGDPKIDKDRAIPLCVEIELKQKDRSIGNILLFVGSQETGRSKDHAGLFSGTIQQGNQVVWLKTLGDLNSIKK
jgi:hypothetical protein